MPLMCDYPGHVWYRGHLLDAILDPNSPDSYISQAVLDRSIQNDNITPLLDTPGVCTASGPVVAETWRGVYVTTLPLRVVEGDWDEIVLGHDWVIATSCKARTDERMEGWPGSWGNENCAWFSCAYYPGEEPPCCLEADTKVLLSESECPSPLWPWGRLAINWIHKNILDESDVRWGSCGIATSSFSSSPPRDVAIQAGTCLLPPLATAANIPQELFDTIIWYIDTDADGQAISHSQVDEESAPYELARCTLICLRWAMVARRLMYAGRDNWVHIHSLSQLRGLAGPGRRVSERLVPVHKLLRRFIAEQTWETHSWIHHIYYSPFSRHRKELRLTGPNYFGKGACLPAWMLRSPHWSVPKTLPSCYLNFYCLQLTHIHFPALSDFAKLIKYFVHAEEFYFYRVSWDVTDVVNPSRSLTTSKPRIIDAYRCTDDHALHAQTRLVLDRHNIPYYHMQERDAFLQFFSALEGCTDIPRQEKEVRLLSRLRWSYPGPTMDIRWQVSKESAVNVCFLYDWAVGGPVVRTICVNAENRHHRNPPDPQILGRYYAILHDELQKGLFPSLSLVTFQFIELADLESLFIVCPNLRTVRSANGQPLTYRLLCRRCGMDNYPFRDMLPKLDGYWWAGIDPSSMQPTGEAWKIHVEKNIIKELGLRASSNLPHSELEPHDYLHKYRSPPMRFLST